MIIVENFFKIKAYYLVIHPEFQARKIKNPCNSGSYVSVNLTLRVDSMNINIFSFLEYTEVYVMVHWLFNTLCTIIISTTECYRKQPSHC